MSTQTTPPPALTVREKELPGILGVSRSTIRREIERGCFPKPIALGRRAIGWRRADIEKWVAGGGGRADDRASTKGR